MVFAGCVLVSVLYLFCCRVSVDPVTRFSAFRSLRLPDPGTFAVVLCPIGWYIGAEGGARLIVNFRDDWLRAFFVGDVRSRRIPSDLEKRLFRKLQLIDDSRTDHDL